MLRKAEFSQAQGHTSALVSAGCLVSKEDTNLCWLRGSADVLKGSLQLCHSSDSVALSMGGSHHHLLASQIFLSHIQKHFSIQSKTLVLLWRTWSSVQWWQGREKHVSQCLVSLMLKRCFQDVSSFLNLFLPLSSHRHLWARYMLIKNCLVNEQPTIQASQNRPLGVQVFSAWDVIAVVAAPDNWLGRLQAKELTGYLMTSINAGSPGKWSITEFLDGSRCRGQIGFVVVPWIP